MSLERRTWWIGRILALLLVLVSLRVAYWQLWRGRALDPVVRDPVAAAREYARMSGAPTPAPGVPETASLAQLPQPVIQRTVQMLRGIRRGTIYDRAGNMLAEDRGPFGDYTRWYADPTLAQTIGYTSALRVGVTGLEATYNSDLLGFDRPDAQLFSMLHRPVEGSSLTLTIDSDIQRAAVQAVGDRPGAVVALDGKTGAVLALVSSPTFDPNRINDASYAASLAGSTALLNRATQGLYTPGSIFKTVTLIAGVDTGQVGPATIFDFGEPKKDASGHIYYTYETGGGVIYDYNHADQRMTLQHSYVTSANAAFARIADEMPPDRFIDYAARLGFSSPDYTTRFPLELPVAEPQLANHVADIRTNSLLRANTGYGQGELLTTPLNMAMVVEAVINNGNIPVPYFVESIRDKQGMVVRVRPSTHVARNLMSAKTANFVRESMVSMITTFYTKNYVPGAVTGGKTGTAQLGGEAGPHAWFIGFSQKGDRTVVIAVVLESSGAGSKEALPVFQQVAIAALK